MTSDTLNHGGRYGNHGIEYGKHGTKALAQPARTLGRSVTLRADEMAIINRLKSAELSFHGGNAFFKLAVPAAPETAEGLPTRTLAAEIFMEKAARAVEKYFGVQHVHAVHGAQGSILLQVSHLDYLEHMVHALPANHGHSR